MLLMPMASFLLYQPALANPARRLFLEVVAVPARVAHRGGRLLSLKRRLPCLLVGTRATSAGEAKPRYAVLVASATENQMVGGSKGSERAG